MRVLANKSTSRSVHIGTIATSPMNITHCDKLPCMLRRCDSQLTFDSTIAHGNCFASYCKRFTGHEVADDGVPWFFICSLPVQNAVFTV
jgi:hypothetical protein